LCPRREGDQYDLTVLLSEAKFVASDGLAKARRSSSVQLRETVNRMQEALFGDPGRLDRDLWLARIGDMMLDGIEVPATEGGVLHEWRRAIRMGTARLVLKGYSHVFVHQLQPGEADPSERQPVANTTQAWQEIFGRDRVRELVLAYHRRQSPRPIRATLGDDTPWDEGAPRIPTRPVVWAAVPRSTPQERGRGTDADDNDGDNPPTPRQPDDHGPPNNPPGPAGTSSESTVATHGDTHVPVPSTEPPVLPPIQDQTGDFAWAAPALRRILRTLATQVPAQTEDEDWLREAVMKLRTALP
jgi:S-DNA-T family DNA segregation ATPase FtsK/SpoIIIE